MDQTVDENLQKKETFPLNLKSFQFIFLLISIIVFLFIIYSLFNHINLLIYLICCLLIFSFIKIFFKFLAV